MHSRSGSALCIGLTIAVGSMTVWAQVDDAGSSERLEVLLTTASAMPPDARLSMMDEAAALWRADNVAIDWLPGTAVRPTSPYRLRVLVVGRRASATTGDAALTVGELLRPSNGHPVAVMAIESAERAIASVRGRAHELVAVDHRRLGLVLGRALAHEIGHYLLGTHTHASHGLMRPQFKAVEFTDPRDGTFVLDRTASEWLKSRAGNERFAYAR